MPKQEYKNSGFILLHRQIREHWLWKDPNRLKWWLDILMECNHADKKVLIGSTLVECKRGQSVNSLRTWSIQWRVDISVVKRFLKLLRNDSMISTEDLKKTTRLTVCNYESYNGQRPAKDLQLTSQKTRKRTTNKESIINNTSIDTLTDKEIFTEEENADWVKFQNWVKKHTPKLLEMKDPFTQKEALSIKKKYHPDLVKDILEGMQNKPDLLKKYDSANLTFKSWARKRLKDTNGTEKKVEQEEIGGSRLKNLSFK